MNGRQRQVLHFAVLVGIVTTAATLFHASAAFSAQAEKTIIDEWADVKPPPPPELKAVTVNPAATAFLVLDIHRGTCNPERRPRCVASVPAIRELLTKARSSGTMVVYSLSGNFEVKDILAEVAPVGGEPAVRSSVDKFLGTNLEKILQEKGIKTVVIAGTAANGAVLHTATTAAQRGLQVIVPVDLMSDNPPYGEQYTAWHLVNAPGSSRQTTLTRSGLIEFKK